VKKWWNNDTDEKFQHLDRTYVKRHLKEWPIFLKRFDWNGKRVLDYGIGGGYLAEVLLNEFRVSEYIGIGLSYKSLYDAKKTLNFASEKVTLCQAPQQFVTFAPDILVTQQVIQHFPSVDYLLEFLGNVDKSDAQELMLHFRQSKSGQTTVDNSYDAGNVSGFALMTHVEFLQQHLDNYVNVWEFTSEMCSPLCCGCQYTGWKRKHD